MRVPVLAMTANREERQRRALEQVARERDRWRDTALSLAAVLMRCEPGLDMSEFLDPQEVGEVLRRVRELRQVAP